MKYLTILIGRILHMIAAFNAKRDLITEGAIDLIRPRSQGYNDIIDGRDNLALFLIANPVLLVQGCVHPLPKSVRRGPETDLNKLETMRLGL